MPLPNDIPPDVVMRGLQALGLIHINESGDYVFTSTTTTVVKKADFEADPLLQTMGALIQFRSEAYRQVNEIRDELVAYFKIETKDER